MHNTFQRGHCPINRVQPWLCVAQAKNRWGCVAPSFPPIRPPQGSPAPRGKPAAALSHAQWQERHPTTGRERTLTPATGLCYRHSAPSASGEPGVEGLRRRRAADCFPVGISVGRDPRRVGAGDFGGGTQLAFSPSRGESLKQHTRKSKFIGILNYDRRQQESRVRPAYHRRTEKTADG